MKRNTHLTFIVKPIRLFSSKECFPFSDLNYSFHFRVYTAHRLMNLMKVYIGISGVESKSNYIELQSLLNTLAAKVIVWESRWGKRATIQ